MATPTNEHVEALAAAMSARPLDHYRHGGEHEPPAVVAMKKRAERVLVAIRTDPAVQDAVLAALVEGGRLVELTRRLSHCPWLRCERDLSGECLDEACRVVTRRRVRLVEPEWRAAP